jgi:hypothetical protein
MPTLDDLQRERRRLTLAGRGLTNTSDNPDENIQPDTRIYVIAFNGGLDGPRLTRSGMYVGPGDAGRSWGRDRRNGNLVRVTWDGDDEPSTHPANMLGICAEADDGGMLLTVSSLEDLGPYPLVDDRPTKQRTAYPLTSSE